MFPARLRLLLCVPLLAIAALTPAPAQQASGATVAASVSPRLVAVGQEAYYTITVRGARNVNGFPQQIEAPGLDIAYRGNQQATTITNGRMSVEVRFNYSVIAEEEGTFTVPPQQVTVDGTQLTTAAVRIVAKVGAETRTGYEPFVKLVAARPALFQGEITPLQIALHVHQRSNLLNLPLPEITHENFVIKRPDRPDRQLTTIDGQPYIVYTYNTTIQGLQPGSFEVGPAKIETTVSMPDRRRGMSGGFFPQMASRKFILRSNPLTLEIKPLPAENKPASFSGAVGKFQLTVAAQPTTLNVGDPVAVDMAISGTGNFDAVTVPALADDTGWRVYPPSTTHENRSLGLEPGVTRYSQVFIPQQMFDALPPFEFSYFDPIAASYVVLQSDAVPLTMSPDPGARLPVEETTFSTAVTAETPVPEEDMTDILQPPVPAAAAWATAATPLLASPVFWAAQSVPAAALLALLVVGIRRSAANRRSGESVAEVRRTAADALADLRARGDAPPADFYRLVAECFDRAGFRPDASSSPELRELYTAAQQSTYAGVAGVARPDAAKRESAIRLLSDLVR